VDTRSSLRAERKLAKVFSQTHGGYEGPSIIEILEEHLLKTCVRYLSLSAALPGGISDKMRTQRGTIRGLAEGVAIVRNPYTTDISSVSAIEREFMRKAKLQRRW
jgi:hypothetical protein